MAVGQVCPQTISGRASQGPPADLTRSCRLSGSLTPSLPCVVLPSRLPVPPRSCPVHLHLRGSEGDAHSSLSILPLPFPSWGAGPLRGQGCLERVDWLEGSWLVPNPALLVPQAGEGQSRRALSAMVTPRALKGRGGWWL